MPSIETYQRTKFGRLFVPIIGSAIITAILSFIIFLLDHPIKYALFVFSASLTALLFLLITKYDMFNFSLNIRLPVKKIDYFFVASAVFLFISYVSGNQIDYVGLILSIVVPYFLPGWVMLRLLKNESNLRKGIVLLVMTFSLSIGLSSVIFLLASLFETNVEGTIISLIYVSISLLPLVKPRIDEVFVGNTDQSGRSKAIHKYQYNILSLLVLCWISIFIIFVISNLYPEMSYLPSTDIARHFSNSKVLFQTPEDYRSEYPWFHFTWAIASELSNAPLVLFQSGFAYLSIIPILSFYILSKSYLQDIDRRAPDLALIFFAVFSGFGWTYLTLQIDSILDPNQDHFDILFRVHDVSYWDIGLGQGPWLWFWFRPQSLGLMIFFVLVFLMRAKEFSGRNYLILTSILIVTLAQTHFPELVVFVLMILALSIFMPRSKIRLKETAIASITGSMASLLLNLSYLQVLNFDVLPSSTWHLSILAAASGLSYLLLRYRWRPIIQRLGRISISDNRVIDLTLIMLFIYGILFFVWLSNTERFFSLRLLRDIVHIWAVPLEFYPMLLGIVGMLAIPGIVIVAKRHRSHPVILFIILLVLTIIFGRILTFVNATIIDTKYWERRLVPFIYASASVLAPIALLYLLDKLNLIRENRKNHANLLKLVSVSTLSSLVLIGILSTLLSVEFELLFISRQALDYEEAKSLEGIFEDVDPKATILTVSERSRFIAEYFSFNRIVDTWKHHLWSSHTPELPLNFLYQPGTPVIFYLEARDTKEQIERNYDDGYLSSHVAELSAANLSHNRRDESTIVVTPYLSPPLAKSDTLLVAPENLDNLLYYAYDLLSLGRYNYTTAPTSDIGSIGKAGTVVAPTEEIGLKLIEYKKNYNLKYRNIIVLNSDGYGPLANIMNSTDSNSTQVEENTSKRRMAYYDGNAAPSVLHKKFDGYDIFYVDIYPALRELELKNTEVSDIYPMLGDILQLTGLELPVNDQRNNMTKFGFSRGGVAAFYNATFSGNMTAYSSSAIIQTDAASTRFRINGENVSSLDDVVQISPVSVKTVKVEGNRGLIYEGFGYYSRMYLTQEPTIHFAGEPTELLVHFKNGTTSTLTGKEIEIGLNPAYVLLRQPKIVMDGLINFDNFYGYQQIQEKTRVLGNDLTVNGKVSFTIEYSDRFSITRGAQIDGELIRSEPIYPYDELEVLTGVLTPNNLIRYGLIVVVIYLALDIYAKKKNKPINSNTADQ